MIKRTRYTRVQKHREEIYGLNKEGRTNLEIADILGFADKCAKKPKILHKSVDNFV